MATRKRSFHSGLLVRLVGLWFASVLVIASASPRWALAQSTDDPWAVPQNISHSGAATHPSILIDSDAVVRVIWQDEFSNYITARFDGGQWSSPQATDLHILFGSPDPQAATEESQEPLFIGQNPFFITGPGGNIFAFWIDPEGSLYASHVPNRDFMNIEAWSELQLLSSSAASFAVAVDARGELQLAYFRTYDDSVNHAGIYHMRSKSNGQDWSLPVLLYESPYFRRLVGGEANLSLATAGTADAPLVYIAWDNRPRKQVFLARSTDGGVSWEQPVQVAGPAADSELASPFNIRIGANGNSANLIWQSGQPGEACTQFFQSSGDAGATWSEPKSMIQDLPGCAQANEFVAGSAAIPGDLLFLLTNIQSQFFLSAWNGFQWSEPQVQPILSEFEDPEIYTQISYDCHRATMSGTLLYIVGCDRAGGGDIWVTSRELESTPLWFSPQVWSQPAPVINDNLDIAAVELIATEDGLIHTCFSQYQDSAINCTRLDGATWSRNTPVLELPDGEAGSPALAAGPGNELFLIARSSRGSLYFSRANSSDAVTASGWSTTTRLQIAHDGQVSAADIAVDASGTLYVAYSVPVNDERGVYLLRSKDQGKTWSEPLQVFDGAAAGFDFVGAPSLLASVNGLMHIIWRRHSIQADGVSQPFSLYYARSEDAGLTFNNAELIVEAPVTWREIVADGNGNLHRMWQQLDIMTTMWDQVSFDGGRSWEVAQRLPQVSFDVGGSSQVAQRLPPEGGTAAATIDPLGRLHLVGGNMASLRHWLWDGSRWQSETPLRWSLDSQTEGPVELLAATINKDGKLIVVLAVPTGEVGEKELLYATRTLDLPPKEAAIQSQSTQLPPPTVAASTPHPMPSLTPAAKVGSGSVSDQSPLDQTKNSDQVTTLARVLLPVALLLFSVLGIVFLRAARVKVR